MTAPAHGQLGEQQHDAACKVQTWYRDPRAPQVFRLFGYAGTGKTSIAARIVDDLGLTTDQVIYTAFTGKATRVLASKGCTPARTIHSLIYQPSSTRRDHLAELEEHLAAASHPRDIARLRTEIAEELERLGTTRFSRRETSDISGARLVVVDECSMIDKRMADDLTSYGTRLLVLGDPAQLPPVRGRGHFITQRPHALLTDIYRSAEDSPVTHIATAVRNAPPGDPDYGIHTKLGDSGRYDNPGDLTSYDQIICWKNSTRWRLIHHLRRLAGTSTPDPEPGDRIVIRANNLELDVRNGQQATVLDAAPAGLHAFDLTIDTEGEQRELRVWARGFTGHAGESEVQPEGRSGTVAAATYGHAITAHTAQGSQWPSVLVVDETNGMRASHEPRKWLYTAVTRASERVVIARPRWTR